MQLCCNACVKIFWNNLYPQKCLFRASAASSGKTFVERSAPISISMLCPKNFINSRCHWIPPIKLNIQFIRLFSILWFYFEFTWHALDITYSITLRLYITSIPVIFALFSQSLKKRLDVFPSLEPHNRLEAYQLKLKDIFVQNLE